MRVCMVMSVPMPPGEGVGYYVWNLSRYLVEQGHQAQIITRGQNNRPCREDLGGIPVWRPPFFPVYPLHVHVHGLFVQRLVRRMEGDVDLFHVHTPLPPPVYSKRPILLTVHSMMLADVRSRQVVSLFDILCRLQAPVSAQIEKRLFGISAKITAVSPAAVRHMQPVLEQTGKSVEVMWNGVNTHFFSPDARKAPEPGTLLFVGRLVPGKGLLDLIQAMSPVVHHYPTTRLRIAGDGPLYRELTSLVAQRGLGRQVEFLGHVGSREHLRDLYQTSWALILPSHHESMPTVVLEAMACGTPVISTEVGSVPEVITDGVNGCLVRPRAPEELAGAICRLLKDAGLRAHLGLAARCTVAERFSWEAVGSGYLRAYQDLLGGKA